MLSLGEQTLDWGTRQTCCREAPPSSSTQEATQEVELLAGLPSAARPNRRCRISGLNHEEQFPAV